jgi:hypothetical protein
MAINTVTGNRNFKTYPAWRRFVRTEFIGAVFIGTKVSCSALFEGVCVGTWGGADDNYANPRTALITADELAATQETKGENVSTHPTTVEPTTNQLYEELKEIVYGSGDDSAANVVTDTNVVPVGFIRVGEDSNGPIYLSDDTGLNFRNSVNPAETELGKAETSDNELVLLVKNGDWKTRERVVLCPKCRANTESHPGRKVTVLTASKLDCQSAVCRLQRYYR